MPMKGLKIFLICIVLGGVFVYNTNWFQSFFLYNRFLESIADVPFDVTKKGETISIPLKHKFNTCYELNVAVPDKNIFHDNIVGPGALRYRFVSGGKILAKGFTFPAVRQHLTLYRGVTLITILVFDLPTPGAGNDVSLELTVDTPMAFLNKYAGKIKCNIRPNYSAKAGGCYNEELRIEY
ncbi:protein of unknown function [Pseudodesulfovibrio piezophilus C1TLV30]|uniref:Uncharacterized protein n=2 Tax=Pseudodesulfovibrio TaxID=2035811 RepID=M1WJU4_PSEP2|nr:protein of unknown function [Pseudodesulfovibrio piezophilus C1TLV30]